MEQPDLTLEYDQDMPMSDKGDSAEFRSLSKVEPILEFLYRRWWRVESLGLERIPAQNEGPCLIVGNQGSVFPWPALMLGHALAKRKQGARKLYVLADLESDLDARTRALLEGLGFLDWSSANMKTLFERGEAIAIFPEGISGLTKPFSRRYRLEEFDWTMLLPVVESGVEVYPVSSLGFDEINPVLDNFELLSKLLKLPFYPVTPFFPWLPMPLNLVQLPVEVSMNVLKKADYDRVKSRDDLESVAKKLSFWLEGEIQAELNRMLRHRGI